MVLGLETKITCIYAVYTQPEDLQWYRDVRDFQHYGMNVLGFMNRKNALHPFIFEQFVHTGVVIACFEDFSKTLKKNGCCHG